MKKIFLLLVILLGFHSAWAHDVVVNGVYYNLNKEDSTATVTYRGSSHLATDDYIGEVLIPDTIICDGVTYIVNSIGKYAFYNCNQLTQITCRSVIIGPLMKVFSNITSIGDYAFYGCEALQTIESFGPLNSIGKNAFYGCKALSRIKIPSTLKSIGENAFYGCKALPDFYIPNTLKSIGDNAFYGCTNIKSVDIASPSALYYIEFSNKYSNPLYYGHHLYYKQQIIYPEGGPQPNYPQYKTVEVKSIDVPEGVSSIGKYTFAGCYGLVTAIIPSSITSIGDGAFEDCDSLTDIIIPDSVHIIGEAVFADCNRLSSITIPHSVTRLGNQCFYGCRGLTSITLSNSLSNLSDECFSGCTSLRSIAIPDSVTRLGNRCFYGCTSLPSITLPTSVKGLGSSCFEGCTGLTSITIPSSVTGMGSACFKDCTGLTSITLPNSAMYLGDKCFAYCTGLTSLIIPNSKFNFGNDCFEGASYKVYSYPMNYSTLKSLYKERVGLYGAPLYELSYKGGTQTKLYFQTKPQSIPYTSADDGVDFRAVESKVYIGRRDTVSLPIPSDGSLEITGLVPHTSYSVDGYVKYSDGNEVYIGFKSVSTMGVNPIIETKAYSPTIVRYTARYTPGEAHVSKVIVNGETIAPSLITCDGDKYMFSVYKAGLYPKTYYKGRITVETEEGSSETVESSVTTPELELTTLQPKCVSSSCAIVAAATNIAEEEPNVGFQWKKYDAPESLKPNEAYAAIYDGQLEGYLKNLQSAFYYNVRAFYKTNDGTYYYGDWVTFDPSDFSYFEPTVHTYPATQTTDCTASVRGYVLAGTDNITEQGFEYWETNGASFAQKLVKNALLVPSAEDINVVLSTGQVMQVVLDGLKPQTTYTYRAFVRTTGGTTYGEEQTFTTEMPTGIDYMESEKAAPTIVGYYDLSGRQLAGKQCGLIIVRYSDGSSRKVMVK